MPLPEITKTIEPYFLLKDDKLREIVDFFKQELDAGLTNYGEDVAMVPTFVPGVPDGSEQG